MTIPRQPRVNHSTSAPIRGIRRRGLSFGHGIGKLLRKGWDEHVNIKPSLDTMVFTNWGKVERVMSIGRFKTDITRVKGNYTGGRTRVIGRKVLRKHRGCCTKLNVSHNSFPECPHDEVEVLSVESLQRPTSCPGA